MSRCLIVNADDLGQTIGVNVGIIHAHRDGILTSATILANGDAFRDAVDRMQGTPELGVGVHVNLVEGRPISPASTVRSLLDHDGRFLSKYGLLRRQMSGGVKLDQLRTEVEAQIDTVCQAGIRPTHLDSHKHIHVYPAFFGTMAQAALSYGIHCMRLPWERMRIRDCIASPKSVFRTLLVNAACRFSRHSMNVAGLTTTTNFAGVLRTGTVTASWLLDWLPVLSEGGTELMVHPGICDDQLVKTGTRLTKAREVELRALTDRRVVAAVKMAGITLIHYGQLTA